MNKLFWIGQYTNSHLKDRLNNAGYKFLSLSRAQEIILKEIINNDNITTISSARLPFKRNNSLIFKGCQWIDEKNNEHHFLNILRIPFIELIYKFFQIKKTLYKFKNYDNSSFIFFGLHSPFLLTARFIKKIFKNSKITFIVPDLPEYYDFKMNIFKYFLKKIDSFIIRSNLSYIDKYVLYSKQMIKNLNITKPYIIMEGMIDSENEPFFDQIGIDEYKDYILYTGAISKGYGLEILIEAFNRINNKNIKLYIVGSGNLIKWLIKKSKENNNIVIHGYISNRKKILSMQKNARVLINCIPPSNVATKYSFPSKILEYLKSESPVISFNLECIPKEYKKHLFIVKNESVDELKNTINNVLSLKKSVIKDRGLKAKSFVLNKKSSKLQVDRILKFIK
jgi:glycosyltransferase involved in cell wall biosynthesis